MLFQNIEIKIKRRQIFYLWCWGLFLLVILLLYPIGYGILRAGTVLLMLLLWSGALFLFWQQKIGKITTLIIGAIALLIIILPGAPIQPNILREYYVQGLNYYEGTTYAWGGENKFGIDCSGLVRQGLVKANLMYGMRYLNPPSLREAFFIWWFDASAETLKTGYLNKTKVLFPANKINDIESNKLQVGDFAVTKDGVHTLAYIGNNIWIEADPGYHKVITVRVPEYKNPWFNTPVYIVRWQQLVNI